jgi:hypothetical protein
MRSFGVDLWKSFKSVQGTLLSGLSLVLAVASFFYTPAAEVRFNWKWVAVVAPLVLAVGATFVDMLVTARRLSYPRLPRVISAYFERRTDTDTGDVEEETVLLLEPSELFGYDGAVSIYYNQRLGGADARPFERLIGVGRVANIQEEKIIAVTVLRYGAGHDAIWSRIRDRDAAALSDIRVKPTVPFRETGLGATVNG